MNFRIAIKLEDEEKEEVHTLERFLADNEGSPVRCMEVAKLEVGQEITFSGGTRVRRLPPIEVRYARFRVPVDFDGAGTATITIDRKRLMMTIRPARRRSVCEVDLSGFAQQMLEKQAKLNVLARRQARRKGKR